jgi:hypothetical protein
VHGVFISSFWYFKFAFKAILPNSDGVNTLFLSRNYVAIRVFRGRLENLDKATFTEKRDIINKLGIKVYPSEDLKTMKIKCSLNFPADLNSQPKSERGIIQFASLRSQ